MNNRGHTARDVEKASMLIKKHGFELGLQIMTGLYADDGDSILRTVQKIIDIAPDTVRIYPTIVLKDTDLEALYLDKIYEPQPLGDAVKLASKLYLQLTRAGIRVIRLGLHSIEEGSYVAGPWHPAFAELCYSQIMLSKVLGCLFTEGKYTIYVNPRCVSQMTGQRKSNLLHLKKRGFDCKVKADATIEELDFKIEREVL